MDLSLGSSGRADIDIRLQALQFAPVVIRSMGGKIEFWTEGMAGIYGFTAEEAQGRLIQELLKTEFPQSGDLLHAQLRETGNWSGELIHCSKDGKRLAVACRWIRRGEGDAATVTEVHTDITDLRLAHQEYFAREAHLQSILETVPDAMIVIDERGIIQSFSAAAQRLFSYVPTEVIGKNIKMLMPSPYREKS